MGRDCQDVKDLYRNLSVLLSCELVPFVLEDYLYSLCCEAVLVLGLAQSLVEIQGGVTTDCQIILEVESLHYYVLTGGLGLFVSVKVVIFESGPATRLCV